MPQPATNGRALKVQIAYADIEKCGTMSTENDAKDFLVKKNIGYHKLSRELRRKIADEYEISVKSFDMIKLPTQISSLPLEEIKDEILKESALVEVKSTGKEINEGLTGFFFGFTNSEQEAAKKLPLNKYKIVFVVIPKNGKNRFFKAMNIKQMKDRIKSSWVVEHIRF